MFRESGFAGGMVPVKLILSWLYLLGLPLAYSWSVSDPTRAVFMWWVWAWLLASLIEDAES